MTNLQMRVRRPARYALAGIAVAACAAVLAPAASAAPERKPEPPRAHAGQVTPDQVAAAAKLAYQAYTYLTGNQLTLAQATQRIINAINSAKQQIIDHVDALAASDGQACTESALIKLDNLSNMSAEQRMDFASANTDCVALIKSKLTAVSSKAAADNLGFALNAVGPIALLSYAYGGWMSTTSLRATLRSANNTVVSKLTPNCFASYLWADQEPGSPVVEVMLTCKSYHSPPHVGITSTFSNRTPFDYTEAKAVAMRDTSYNVALRVLPSLA
jgi:hypothetical protein